MTTMTSVTVRVPLTIRRRGGRTMIISPDGVATDARSRTPADIEVTRGDPALVKALARAFRWRRMLENGRHGSISELAAAENLDRGYLGRLLALTLLAPDIVEAIMDGRQPTEMTLPVLMKALPAGWVEQQAILIGDNPGQRTRAVTAGGGIAGVNDCVGAK